MASLLKLLTARTGLEWALYITAPIFLVIGLVTGNVVLLGKSGSVTATMLEHPWWYWGIMLFHALCSVGLIVSLRACARNKGRWFPDR